MSTIIKVRCTDQVLTFENTPVIASGGLEEDYIVFDFCSKWDGFVKTAVFWRSEKDAYHVGLDGSGSCAIPPEVLQDEGVIYFGVFGVNADGIQRTSQVLNYRIVKGAITTGTKPSDPTPDIYTQMLAYFAEAKAKYEDAKAKYEDAREVVEQRRNPNLLDNWYFADPINQRGQTECTEAEYFIDRWHQMGNTTKETIVDGGIKATLLATNASYKYALYQTIENPERFVGKEVTFSALVTDFRGSNNRIKVSCRSSSGELRGMETKINSTGIVSVTGIVPEGTTIFWAAPCIFPSNSVVSDYITVSAVKLELGSTQTLAHQDENGNWVLNDPPPDKGMELLKCCMSTADSADTYANNKVTPAAINAVNKNGDTMTGELNIAIPNKAKIGLIPEASGVRVQAYTADWNKRKFLWMPGENATAPYDTLQYVDMDTTKGKNGRFDILHTGNFNTLIGGARVATGSYVGTGTCGLTGPNTISFGFVPKMLWVWQDGYCPNGRPGKGYTIPCANLTTEYTKVEIGATSSESLMVKLVGNTVSFYSPDGYMDDEYGVFIFTNFVDQLNVSGTTYYYMAIG